MISPYDFLNTLCQVTLAASLLVVVILAVQQMLSRWLTPQWSYLLWLLVFIRLVIPVAPGSSFSVYNLLEHDPVITEQANEPASVFFGTLPRIIPGPITTDANQVSPVPEASNLKAHHLLLAVWLLGVLVAVSPLIRGVFALRALRRSSHPCTDTRTLCILEECHRLCGVSRAVPLRVSSHFMSPALVGVWRPYILLSESMLEGCTRDELRHIFLHELTHLRRRDTLVWCITALVTALHWFNPLVWLAFSRLRREQEMACDAGVLALLGRTGEPLGYSQTLFRLTNQFSATRPVVGALGIVESKSQLRRRIEIISKHRRAYWYQPAIGAAVACVLLVTTFTSAQETPPVKTAPSDKSEPVKPTSVYFGQWAGQPLSGDKPFRLTVHETEGELIYTYNEQSKELSSIEAKKKAQLETENYTLSADHLRLTKSDDDNLSDFLATNFSEFKAVSDKDSNADAFTAVFDTQTTGLTNIIAEKCSLKFSKQGAAECSGDRLYFNLATDEIWLSGNALLSVKDSAGAVTTTSGKEIRIQNVTGKPRFTVRANRFTVRGNPSGK